MQSITSMPQRLRESSQRIGAFTPTGTKLLINIYAHKFAMKVLSSHSSTLSWRTAKSVVVGSRNVSPSLSTVAKCARCIRWAGSGRYQTHPQESAQNLSRFGFSSILLCDYFLVCDVCDQCVSM